MRKDKLETAVKMIAEHQNVGPQVRERKVDAQTIVRTENVAVDQVVYTQFALGFVNRKSPGLAAIIHDSRRV